MPAIHFIERHENVHPTDKEKGEWESGDWVVSEETAQRLVGGHIYLHHAQDEPSHFGGEILSFHVLSSGSADGRVVFRFCASITCKGVKAGREGWGNEKKIVW